MSPSSDILARPTLVLNRSWQPIHVTTVVRALVMLWNESAKVVDPEEYRLYSWADWMALPPSRGGPASGRPARGSGCRRSWPSSTSTGCRRPRSPSAGGTSPSATITPASTAGRSRASTELTIDHVVPRAQGGPSSWTNCVAACAGCNARKADRTPEQAGMRLRKSPARPDWKPLYALQALAHAHHLDELGRVPRPRRARSGPDMAHRTGSPRDAGESPRAADGSPDSGRAAASIRSALRGSSPQVRRAGCRSRSASRATRARRRRRPGR